MSQPPSPALASFERMLKSGRDGAMLRLSLGNEHLKAGNAHAAVLHLQRAVEFDSGYTAAWKALGKALADDGQLVAALVAYREGIAVAQRKGDKQAGREMEVFARRLEKTITAAPDAGV